jgi:hypothetical protein
VFQTDTPFGDELRAVKLFAVESPITSRNGGEKILMYTVL